MCVLSRLRLFCLCSNIPPCPRVPQSNANNQVAIGQAGTIYPLIRMLSKVRDECHLRRRRGIKHTSAPAEPALRSVNTRPKARHSTLTDHLRGLFPLAVEP